MLGVLKHKLSVFFEMAHEERRLLIEAVFYLALARFCVRFLPLRWYMNSLGSEKPPLKPSDEIVFVSKSVSVAIKKAANNVPWNAVCLPQAIAAKWMLGKRCIPSVLFLGVSTSNEDFPENETLKNTVINKPQLAAHAWLKTDGIVVTGKADHEKFTILKTF